MAFPRARRTAKVTLASIQIPVGRRCHGCIRSRRAGVRPGQIRIPIPESSRRRAPGEVLRQPELRSRESCAVSFLLFSASWRGLSGASRTRSWVWPIGDPFRDGLVRQQGEYAISRGAVQRLRRQPGQPPPGKNGGRIYALGGVIDLRPGPRPTASRSIVRSGLVHRP